MEIKKTFIGKYFNKSAINLIKSRFIFFIVSLFEIYDLTLALLTQQSNFFQLNKNRATNDSKLNEILLQISPYLLYCKGKDQNEKFHNATASFNGNYILVIIHFGLLLLFYLYLFFHTDKINNEKQDLRKIVDKVSINFYDFFLFRLVPLYGFDSAFRCIFDIVGEDELNILNIVLQIILVAFLFFAIFTYIYYFFNVCIWHNFYILNSYIHKYPYDFYFSQKFDIVMFILKILISLNQAYLDYKVGNFNLIFMFLSFISNAIYLFYFVYVFFTIVISKDCLYVYVNFANKMRVFYLLFLAEILILHIAYHASDDYIPFFTFTVIFIIFNLYVVFGKIAEFLYNKAVESQNFLAVFWFLVSNDVNKQDFTIEWIANHRTKCILKSDDCPICSKLKQEIDIYSDSYLKKLNEESTGEFFLNLGKTKKNNEFVKSEKRTMISNMFPPFIFFKALIGLIEKNKKSLTKTDLIRYDFIQLTTLFQSDDKLIDFIIYNKIYYCISKHQKNSRVLMTYCLLYDLFGLSEKISKQKYEILQKNEELRNSLNKYLKEYEEFILYKEKSPVNYLDISNKYKNFKDLLITIHVYFKNNIECNYELILMRYIYEILVNTKFSHTQPFDLNTYSEFLEYHFSHSRILLLKYNIEKEVFLIIKGSKEMQKYQGKQFNMIFPRELRDEGAMLFKNQLCNLNNKNESKTIFEFVVETKIKDTKFIDSFKMNFAIYPTTLINELFLQANYKIGYLNLIVFESYNEEESLYSYSFQLYKVFGITPKDIHLLKSSGISFNFNTLFKKRIIETPENKEEKENQKEKVIKQEYSFSYRDYISIYKKLINLDVIKESQDYSQMSEKFKQFELQAKDDKELTFQITKKFECETKLKTYYIYSIKEIKKKRFKKNDGKGGQRQSEYFENDYTNDKGGFFEEDSDNEENESNEFNSNADVFEGKGMTMAGSILSVSKASSIGESLRARGKKDDKMEEKKLKRQKLYKSVYIILGFGILLIGISVIFLILEDSENIKFKKLIDLFYIFHVFKRGIESIPLTILANYKYNIYGNLTEDIYRLYSEKLGEKYPVLQNPVLSDLLLLDASTKLVTVIQSFNNYLKELHSIEENLSNQITNLMGKSYKIEVMNERILLYNLPTSIITIGREYLNSLSILLDNNSFLTENFILLTKAAPYNNITCVNRDSKDELSMTGKSQILLLLIYPFLHDGLTKISDFILDKSNDIVHRITNIYIIFFCILLFFHVILLVIGMIFIYSFLKILKMSIEQGNKVLEDKKFLEFLDKKLTQIKIMKSLYLEDPIKIMDKIESLDEMFKNKNKEDAKDKANNNMNNNLMEPETKEDSKTGENQKNATIHNSPSLKVMFKDDFKGLGGDADKEKKDLMGKDEFQSLNISNLNQKVPNKKLKVNEFYSISIVEFILLYFSFILYFLYSIIMLIIIISGINKLYNLIDYMRYNDLYDAYAYDNVIAYYYLLNTNSTSNFYGGLTNTEFKSNSTRDYIEENIELLYDSAKSKDNIEQYKESYFKPFGTLTNFNCSNGIIQDEEMIAATNIYNVDFNEYFGELCKEFPVASTGVPINVIYEIVYITGKIYRKYETPPTFEITYTEHYLDDELYNLLTLILVFFRFQRNFFYNNVLMNEVNDIMDYFSNLILLYLVFCIIFESVVFIIFYFGIIREVKKKDKLFNNFIESFKYD